MSPLPRGLCSQPGPGAGLGPSREIWSSGLVGEVAISQGCVTPGSPQKLQAVTAWTHLPLWPSTPQEAPRSHLPLRLPPPPRLPLCGAQQVTSGL